MRPALSLLLLLALLLRGGLAPGVMPEVQAGQVSVVLCGISGGTVTLDLGLDEAGHTPVEEHCLFAGLAMLGLPSTAATPNWGHDRTWPAIQSGAFQRLQALRAYDARGPPHVLG